MNQDTKTKEQLVDGLVGLQRQIDELKAEQGRYEQIKNEFVKQQRFLKGLAQAKHCLLTATDTTEAINEVLRILIRVTGVDYIGIFDNHFYPEKDSITFSHRFGWDKKLKGPCPADPKLQEIAYGIISGTKRWYNMLSSGKVICKLTDELNTSERLFIGNLGINSFMLVPIFAGDKFWGFMNFVDYSSERKWTESEKSLLITMAASIGGTLERRHVEEVLQEKERRFRLLIENTSDIISVFDREGKILFLSPSVEHISGFKVDDLMSKNVVDYIHPDDMEKMMNTFSFIIQNPGISQTIELRLMDSKGRWVYIESTLRNLLQETGIEGIVGNSRDITQRRASQDELEAEKERLAVTLRSIGEGVITTDIDGRIVLVNKAAERLTGWTQEESASRPLTDIFKIMDQKTRRIYKDPLRKVLRPRGISSLDTRTILIGRDGTERIISDTGVFIRDKSNNIIGIVLVFRDITEKIVMEEELIKAGKIESISVLAGGIAHDFNNILTIMLGNISLAVMHIKSGNREKAIERLVDVERSSQQARDLTQQLLTFAKGGPAAVKTVSIADLLKDTVNFALCGSKILRELFINDNLWLVEADEGQISQVLNNLIINAQHAMPEGGIIKVYAENAVIASEYGPALKPGRYVKIAIEDTGVGIPEENLLKIFEPYFTTKPKGSGLGLATSYAIIKKHSGHITAKSQIGKGATFYIYLPASDKQITEKRVEEELIKYKGKVLVIDDEKAVREVVGMMLNHIGYEVVCAASGSEAIEIYKKCKCMGEPFDAVLMDLTMPGGMGGKEVIKKFLEIDPEVIAVATSGYSNDPVMINFREYGFKDAIAKPFKINDLGKAIHRIIEEEEKIQAAESL